MNWKSMLPSPVKKPRRQRLEDAIQRALVQHLEVRGAPGLVWFAVPNGGLRAKLEAKIMKALGTRAGVADLIMLHESRFYALELKAPGKKPSELQVQFLSDVADAGGYGMYADSLDMAIKLLESHRLLQGRVQ